MGITEELTEAPLPPEMRLATIQQMLGQQRFVRVRDLANRFGVSTVTVRADLQMLEERRQACRVHGGAIPFDTARGERSFEEVAEQRVDEKLAIARAAAQMVDSGETVIVDVGTTTAALARALVDRTELSDVNVVTNGLKIALLLEAAHPRFTVVVSGGTLRPKQHSLVEPLATTIFDELRVDTVFIGCNGVSVTDGVTNINLPEAAVKRSMIASASRTVVLADGSKVGGRALAPICAVDDVDVLITDDSADAESVGALRDRGVDVIIA